MYARVGAAVLLAACLAACQSDVTTPDLNLNDPAGPVDPAGRESDAPAPASGDEVVCPTCTFEPQTYTRRTGTPVTEVVSFPGNPAGAYIIEISDLGTRGANATVELNGISLDVRSGQLRREITLTWANTLHTRLTGKPGSKLSVRVFQEIASVEVTPGSARSRMSATLQFSAVAKDRNGVAIPRQTFTWTSNDPTIATVDALTGLATTTGPTYGTAPWTYMMNTTGAGVVAIAAQPRGAPGFSGTGTWTVVPGFVYATYRAALPIASPNRSTRSTSRPFRYDTDRLRQRATVCTVEHADTSWQPQAIGGTGERMFRQCYPQLELETPTRHWVDPIFGEPHWEYGSDNNVGLWGRYCGGGQPAGTWWGLAKTTNYPPADPLDALCMDHDNSLDLHELDPTWDAAQAACIVRYGIESETLHEEGVRVMPGTARWNAFWSTFPRMADARQHWLAESGKACFGPFYNKFLSDRGLTI